MYCFLVSMLVSFIKAGMDLMDWHDSTVRRFSCIRMTEQFL